MGAIADRIRRLGRQSAVPSEDGAGVGYIDEREQAIIDRHTSEAKKGNIFQKAARGAAKLEIAERRQWRAYAEQASTEVSEPIKEMLSNLDNRTKVRSIYQKLTPEQRQEALNLVPGISQQLGDDRGGALSRVGGALRRGVSTISQPAVELADKVLGTDWGGTPEEIEFIRQMEAAKAQEFAPALPSDPWYERFPLQALEMVPFSAATLGGGAVGGAVGKAGGNVLARGAAAGVPGARGVMQAAGAVGRIPTAVGLPAMTAQGVGTVAGITAVGFPGQYAQEIDQLKELGVEDGPGMQALAVGTALASSALEAIMPNPFKGVLPAGKVAIQDGALKAARQYLWEAIKRAPPEISEEYAQGLASGLGKTVASYLDMTTKDVSVGDAFATSFEQGNAAIGPMAFLLGVPALAGAGAVGFRARGGAPPGPPPVTQAPPVQPPVVAPGGISPTGTLPEVTPPVDQTAVVPPTVVPNQDQSQDAVITQRLAALDKPPGAHKWAEIVLGDRTRFKDAPDEATRTKQWQQSRGTVQQPPLPQGVPDASQVPDEASVQVQGNASQGQVRQAEAEADGTQVQVEPPFARLAKQAGGSLDVGDEQADAYNRQRGKEIIDALQALSAETGLSEQDVSSLYEAGFAIKHLKAIKPDALAKFAKAGISADEYRNFGPDGAIAVADSRIGEVEGQDGSKQPAATTEVVPASDVAQPPVTTAPKVEATVERAMDIESRFGLSAADGHFFNVAIDAVAANPSKWTTLAEGIQKEALKASVSAKGSLEKVGNIKLAKAIAEQYLSVPVTPAPQQTEATTAPSEPTTNPTENQSSELGRKGATKKPSPEPTGEQDTGTSRGQSGEQVGNKPETTEASGNQVNVDSGAESKVKPEAGGPTTTAEQEPAAEQARENLRKRGKKKPSQAELDAETAAVIREREADNKVQQDFRADRDAQKAQDARREFVASRKSSANPATVDSISVGDIAQVNDDIERGRVSYDDATKVADEFVDAGYLPQGKREQIRNPTTSTKQSPEAEPLPEPPIPKFTRTTSDKGSTTRQFQAERVEKARAEIADLERKRRAKQGEHDKLRSNATKKRAAVRGEIESFNRMIGKIQGEIASDMASDTLAKLEDELESPRSYDHYLAGMKAIHRLKSSVAEDAARRGEMGREAARTEVAKEEREADRFDAELQGRAKELAKSQGFESGDAEQIALAASNGFTVFEDRSLADIVEVQGKRTRESRVSQEIGKMFSPNYSAKQDLSDEQKEAFKKQYEEASQDDKNWLVKRGEVDKAVREAIKANREAIRQREDSERKEEEAEKAKSEQEALANARERAKKYFLDERISKALKKQKPKTKPVKIRRESAGGPVKIVDGKTIDGDQNGELYPNGLILHKSFEEGSKDFVLTHARSGLGFPLSAKKSDIQELIGLINLLGVDFNVDTDASGHLPAELIARIKKINTAWDNGDYAMLSEQDYATVEALAEVAKTDIDADLILTADDLGANGIPRGLDNVMTDNGLRLVKQMAVAVPEFAYDPVFTVKDGKLLYRDGYEFKLEPTAFNLHPSELKEGQTVGINLEDLGIKRATPQDVVAEVMKGSGLPRVTKGKGGDVSVGYVGSIPTSLQQGESDNDWVVVGGSPKVRDMAIAALKKIRWRQTGQDGDTKTDINEVAASSEPQTTDSKSETVEAQPKAESTVEEDDSGEDGATPGVAESRSLDAFTSPELQNRQSMGAAKTIIASAADLVGDDDGGTGSEYASPDKEFERRWQMATRGIGKKTLATKLREFWQELVKSTVRGSLPELPRTEQFGEARSAMHAYQNAPVYAQLATADLLKKTSKPLSASDYDLFTRIVIMRDQMEAADKGERLSYGLTPAKAKSELARVEALAANNERVQASLEYRKQWTEAMVNDFLSAHEYLGLDMGDRFKRENYFRHQVLYYMEAQQRGLGKKKVELTPNRGWLKGRTSGDDLGEGFDINANYLQAEWEVSTQMIADTKRAQAIGRLKRHYDKMRQLKAQAKQNNYVAVVGGQKVMDEIEELRGKMDELRAIGSLDSSEKAQMKEWSERLWELDPTMPFRRDMAIAREQIDGIADSLGEEVPDDFMRYVSALAKRDDSPLQGPALAFLKAVADRKAFIKSELGDNYQTWEDVVPDDHEEVAIRPGRAMFQAYSVPEQIASELMADLSKTLGISAEDLRPLTALGSKYTPLVVPKEVAAQMAAVDNKMDFGWLDHMVTRPMNAWKRWVLMSPTRVLKYNLRNLSEIDKVMALNPAAIKDIPQAVRDLWKLYSGADDIPATVRDWVERGGSSTLVRVNELGELNELKQFAKLISDKKSGVVGKVINAPVNLWKTYWSSVGIGSDFRESILRYAAYLNYVKQLEAGKLTNYGGSVRSEVDGIKDNKDKAMRLSADLLGDYGDISLVGQFMRSRAAPFWSFQETNVRTYFRGLMNLAGNEQSAIKAGMAVARAAGIGGLAKAPFLAYKLGRIAILFYGLKAMTTAFNQLLFSDDDDELTEEEKRKAHLTFGKNSKGEVQYFSRIGTAADVLDWVGLDSVDYDLRDVLDGRRTLRDVLSDMTRSPVDKAYGMLSPFIKLPTELAVGQTAYPSVGKPRPIRDRGQYIAQNLGIRKEYDKLVGNPATPYSFTDIVLYKVEPGTSAYYMTQDAKYRWLKEARNRGIGYSDSVRGNALRSYKMALRLNDKVAVDKYLAEYEAAGGTKEGMLDSLESSHPAGGLSTIDAYLFYKSLVPVEQAEYKEAERFYYSELLTEEQAKAIRSRRDKRLRDIAFGKNKDGSHKGKPEKQSDETVAKYRERLRDWEEQRKIAREAIQEYKKRDSVDSQTQ